MTHTSSTPLHPCGPSLPALRSLALLLAATGLPAISAAAPPRGEPRGYNLDRFAPAPGDEDILTVRSGALPRHLEWDLAHLTGFSRQHLGLRRPDGGLGWRPTTAVRRRVGGYLLGSVGLLDWFQLGVELPFVIHQQGKTATGPSGVEASIPAAAVGDVMLSPKLRLLEQTSDGVSLALAASVSLPTADAMHAYAGERRATVAPEIDLARRFGMVEVAANLGYLERPRVRSPITGDAVDDELYGRLGAALRAGGFRLQAALTGYTAGRRPLRSPHHTGAEALGGVAYDRLEHVSVYVGGGGRIHQSPGAPRYRLFFGWRIADRAYDADSDGVHDREDACPAEPEDRDGFQDADGCVDSDNDQDGIPDATDAAPGLAEDSDGYRDSDGAPDPDNDGDGIEDTQDHCPNDPETVNDYRDEDGCPDALPDADTDGVPDSADRCEFEAEDRDDFSDEDGCPDPDNDQDGVQDADDGCPREPGPANHNGCPDPAAAEPTPAARAEAQMDEAVQVALDRVQLKRRIHFETGTVQVARDSWDLLDEVAELVKNRPDIATLTVVGHTDSRGSESANQSISEQRANAVRAYLVARGVQSARISALGVGAAQPIASNTTSEGRAVNRRVEFRITRQPSR